MKQRPLHRERPRLFALEARFMFDGAAVDTAIAATEAAEAPPAAQETSAESRRPYTQAVC